jgi:hypothetical protein
MIEKDDRGHAFKQQLIDLLESCNQEQLEWAIEYLWCFRRMTVLKWMNRHFFKMEL